MLSSARSTVPIPIVSTASSSAIASSRRGRIALISGRKLRKVARLRRPDLWRTSSWDGTTHPLTVAALQQHGGARHQGHRVGRYRTNTGWVVNDIEADGVIMATLHTMPAASSMGISTALGSFDTSDVAIVTVRSQTSGLNIFRIAPVTSSLNSTTAGDGGVVCVSKMEPSGTRGWFTNSSNFSRKRRSPDRSSHDADLLNVPLKKHLSVRIHINRTKQGSLAGPMHSLISTASRRTSCCDRWSATPSPATRRSSYRGIRIPACIADGTMAEELLASMAN